VLVTDGRPLADVPEGEHDGVRVLYARRGGQDAADDRIVEELRGLGLADTVHVITSDRALVHRAEALGATTAGARSLLTRLDALDAANP
jgi:predicted RNA-binding protein with PIN domain